VRKSATEKNKTDQEEPSTTDFKRTSSLYTPATAGVSVVLRKLRNMDTATFFVEGTANQFEHVLSLYPQALRIKAEAKTKKPEDLIKLDNWWVPPSPQGTIYRD